MTASKPPRFVHADLPWPALRVARIPRVDLLASPLEASIGRLEPITEADLWVYRFRVAERPYSDCKAAYDPVEHVVYTDNPWTAREAWRAGLFEGLA